MARFRAPSRRTVLAVASLAALAVVVLVMAPDDGASDASAEVLLLMPDGSAAASARFDAASLARLRAPEPPAPVAAGLAGSLPGAATDSVGAGVPGDSASSAGAPTPGSTTPSPPFLGVPVDATPSAPVDTGGAAPDTAPEPPTLRIPLVLALRSSGGTVRPEELRLGVPAPFRLAVGGPVSAARGPGVAGPAAPPDTAAPGPGDAGPEEAEDWGTPMAYYAIPLRDVEVRADEPPARLTASDTVWLEYDRPDLDCALDGDSVPRFQPALPTPAGSLEDVRIFYSLADRRGGRSTGVLRLALELPDGAAPEPETAFAAALASAGPVELRANGFAVADTTLQTRASYAAVCADAAGATPLAVRFLASGTGPGRAYLVGAGKRPRLRLEDLDGDDVIEREAWDPDGDGRFEAGRALRLALPKALDGPERRAYLEEQRRAVAAQQAAEAARRVEARRARADSAAARAVPPDTSSPEPPRAPPDSSGAGAGPGG